VVAAEVPVDSVVVVLSVDEAVAVVAAAPRLSAFEQPAAAAKTSVAARTEMSDLKGS
jgi:hypothetical protein